MKRRSSTALKVTYAATLRIISEDKCCGRWYNIDSPHFVDIRKQRVSSSMLRIPSICTSLYMERNAGYQSQLTASSISVSNPTIIDLTK